MLKGQEKTPKKQKKTNQKTPPKHKTTDTFAKSKENNAEKITVPVHFSLSINTAPSKNKEISPKLK